MNVLSKIVTGSRLYGTDVPTSDWDYRGVYLPSKEDCYLTSIRHTIDDNSEQDTSYFSLQTFLRLASEGQSVAIEMLAAPPWAVSKTSAIWEAIHARRRIFYTKNMYAFLGYAKSMASKYSSRIDRLNETKAVLDVFDNETDGGDVYLPGGRNERADWRLSDIWDRLPESLNAVRTTNSRSSNKDKRVYQVCGRELQATVTIAHAYSVVQSIHDSYGERVRAAKKGNIDWKALMHAFRVAYQAKQIAETGDLIFPLPEAVWLKEVRLGNVDFLANGLDKKLDNLILEVQEKLDRSALPDKVDKAVVDQLILNAYDCRTS